MLATMVEATTSTNTMPVSASAATTLTFACDGRQPPRRRGAGGEHLGERTAGPRGEDQPAEEQPQRVPPAHVLERARRCPWSCSPSPAGRRRTATRRRGGRSGSRSPPTRARGTGRSGARRRCRAPSPAPPDRGPPARRRTRRSAARRRMSSHQVWIGLRRRRSAHHSLTSATAPPYESPRRVPSAADRGDGMRDEPDGDHLRRGRPRRRHHAEPARRAQRPHLHDLRRARGRGALHHGPLPGDHRRRPGVLLGRRREADHAVAPATASPAAWPPRPGITPAAEALLTHRRPGDRGGERRRGRAGAWSWR